MTMMEAATTETKMATEEVIQRLISAMVTFYLLWETEPMPFTMAWYFLRMAMLVSTVTCVLNVCMHSASLPRQSMSCYFAINWTSSTVSTSVDMTTTQEAKMYTLWSFFVQSSNPNRCRKRDSVPSCTFSLRRQILLEEERKQKWAGLKFTLLIFPTIGWSLILWCRSFLQPEIFFEEWCICFGFLVVFVCEWYRDNPKCVCTSSILYP